MRNKKTGFTLIELLVAISVLAIVAVLGWRGLDSIVRARVALTSDMEQTRGMQLAFAQLQSDCAQIANTGSIPDRAPVVVNQGRLILVRHVFAENQPTRLQVIAYRLKEDGVLTRRESPATRDMTELDTMWRIAMSDADTTTPVRLQSGLSAMTMRTWAGNGAGWRSAADLAPTTPAGPAAAPTVLTGLEVTLQLRERPHAMTKVFMLGPV